MPRTGFIPHRIDPAKPSRIMFVTGRERVSTSPQRRDLGPRRHDADAQHDRFATVEPPAGEPAGQALRLVEGERQLGQPGSARSARIIVTAQYRHSPKCRPRNAIA